MYVKSLYDSERGRVFNLERIRSIVHKGPRQYRIMMDSDDESIVVHADSFDRLLQVTPRSLIPALPNTGLVYISLLEDPLSPDTLKESVEPVHAWALTYGGGVVPVTAEGVIHPTEQPYAIVNPDGSVQDGGVTCTSLEKYYDHIQKVPTKRELRPAAPAAAPPPGP